MDNDGGQPERRSGRERRDQSPAGYTHLGLTYWKGVCGHVWDRLIDDTDECPRCALAAKVAERDALFDLQFTRTREADALWQTAHPGMEGVWPDLGELIGWLSIGHHLVKAWRDAALHNDADALFNLTNSSDTWLTDALPTHRLPSDRRQTGSALQLAVDILTPWHAAIGGDLSDGVLRKCIDVRCGATSAVVPVQRQVRVWHHPGCAVDEMMRRLGMLWPADDYTVRVDEADPRFPTIERADGSLWREPTEAEAAAARQTMDRFVADAFRPTMLVDHAHRRVLADHYPTAPLPEMPGGPNTETPHEPGAE